MTWKGTHTWDLVLHYHRCPKCNYIFDNRVDFEYRLGKYQKDLECPRCHALYTVTKVSRLFAGPFFGEGDRIEIMWR